jgi:hypothetical protein
MALAVSLKPNRGIAVHVKYCRGDPERGIDVERTKIVMTLVPSDAGMLTIEARKMHLRQR